MIVVIDAVVVDAVVTNPTRFTCVDNDDDDAPDDAADAESA